jgi:hypothetical protein
MLSMRHTWFQDRRLRARRTALVAALVACSLASSCGVGADSSALEASTRSLPTEVELKSTLLTPGDVGVGWSAVIEDDAAQSPLCGVRLSSLLPPEASMSSANSTLRRDVDGVELGSEVAVVAGVPAGEIFAEFRKRLEVCTEALEDGTVVTVQLTDGPGVGDESMSGRVTAWNDGRQVGPEATVTFVRVGSVFVFVGLIAPSSVEAPGADEYVSIATTKAQSTLATFAQ